MSSEEDSDFDPGHSEYETDYDDSDESEDELGTNDEATVQAIIDDPDQLVGKSFWMKILGAAQQQWAEVKEVLGNTATGSKKPKYVAKALLLRNNPDYDGEYYYRVETWKTKDKIGLSLAWPLGEEWTVANVAKQYAAKLQGPKTSGESDLERMFRQEGPPIDESAFSSRRRGAERQISLNEVTDMTRETNEALEWAAQSPFGYTAKELQKTPKLESYHMGERVQVFVMEDDGGSGASALILRGTVTSLPDTEHNFAKYDGSDPGDEPDDDADNFAEYKSKEFAHYLYVRDAILSEIRAIKANKAITPAVFECDPEDYASNVYSAMQDNELDRQSWWPVNKSNKALLEKGLAPKLVETKYRKAVQQGTDVDQAFDTHLKPQMQPLVDALMDPSTPGLGVIRSTMKKYLIRDLYFKLYALCQHGYQYAGGDRDQVAAFETIKQQELEGDEDDDEVDPSYQMSQFAMEVSFDDDIPAQYFTEDYGDDGFEHEYVTKVGPVNGTTMMRVRPDPDYPRKDSEWARYDKATAESPKAPVVPDEHVAYTALKQMMSEDDQSLAQGTYSTLASLRVYDKSHGTKKEYGDKLRAAWSNILQLSDNEQVSRGQLVSALMEFYVPPAAHKQSTFLKLKGKISDQSLQAAVCKAWTEYVTSPKTNAMPGDKVVAGYEWREENEERPAEWVVRGAMTTDEIVAAAQQHNVPLKGAGKQKVYSRCELATLFKHSDPLLCPKFLPDLDRANAAVGAAIAVSKAKAKASNAKAKAKPKTFNSPEAALLAIATDFDKKTNNEHEARAEVNGLGVMAATGIYSLIKRGIKQRLGADTALPRLEAIRDEIKSAKGLSLQGATELYALYTASPPA